MLSLVILINIYFLISARTRELHIGETESGFTLVCCDTPRDLDDVFIEGSSHEIQVGKDKGLLYVKSNSNDIPGVISREALDICNSEVLFEQEFLIVCHHDDQRDVKDVL